MPQSEYRKSDNHQALTSCPFSLRYLRLSVRRGHDRIRSVHVLGPSSMHSPYVKATAGLLNRRCHVQMSQMCLCVELGLVNSDPWWSFMLAGVAGAVSLWTGGWAPFSVPGRLNWVKCRLSVWDRYYRYGLTLWCTLSLLVGGALQVPQLQFTVASL